MGDINNPPDSSSPGETDIGTCSGHTDREKTDSSPAENGGVDAPRAQRALLQPQFAHQNEQLAAPEDRRGQSMIALTFPYDVSSEPPPSEGAAQVDDATFDERPWWERSSGTRDGQPKEEDVCGASDQDALNVCAITGDPEFQELPSEAPVQVCQESSDAIANVTAGCSPRRSAGSSVDPQPSSNSKQQDGEPVQSARTTPSGNNAVLGALADLGVDWHKEDIPELTQAIKSLGLCVRDTTGDDQVDRESQELQGEAKEKPQPSRGAEIEAIIEEYEAEERANQIIPERIEGQESSDATADVKAGCSPRRSAGQGSSVQPQPSSHDIPDELEGLVLNLEELNRTYSLLTQTTAEKLLRQYSETQRERLWRLRIRDNFSSSLFTGPRFRTIPEDVNLCMICRLREVHVRILECGHCHWCLDCFMEYVEPARPRRCPVCKRRMKSHELR